MKLKTIEVAKKLRITPRQVRRLIKSKLLPAEKVGKDYFISEEALAFYEQGHSKTIKEKLDKMTEYADIMVANPETIEHLKKLNIGIKSKFIGYEEYLDDLFSKKKIEASERIKLLPHLSPSVANATIDALYNEFRECFVLGVNGAAITLAILLFESAMKYRIYNGRKTKDDKITWDNIEKLSFIDTLTALRKDKVIDEHQEEELRDFNIVRNNYFHYKIEKLVSQVFMEELPSLNVHTGEIVIHKNVFAKDIPSLWFSAKKKIDKETVVGISAYCLKWVNDLLATK